VEEARRRASSSHFKQNEAATKRRSSELHQNLEIRITEEIAMSRRNKWAGSVSAISAFTVGIGVGAALGILFAPNSGEDTRDLIAETAQDGIDGAVATGRKWTRRAQTGLDQAKDQVRQATEVGEQAFREAKNSAS
jgi:gas vesicle protein